MLLEPVPPVLANRLEEAVANIGIGELGLDEALVHQRCDQTVDLELIQAPRSKAHGLSRFEVEASGEHRQPAQYGSLLVVEELEGPVDGAVEGPLARQRGATLVTEEPESVV